MTSRTFGHFAAIAARASGSLGAFVAALGVVIVWAGSGPLFKFNDTWQLVINTGTTIVTFLMVFLIQHTSRAGPLHGAQAETFGLPCHATGLASCKAGHQHAGACGYGLGLLYPRHCNRCQLPRVLHGSGV